MPFQGILSVTHAPWPDDDGDVMIPIDFGMFLMVMSHLFDRPSTSSHPACSHSISNLKLIPRLSQKRVQKHIQCAICLEPFKKAQRNTLMMPCRHLFHKGCVERWLRSSGTCPTCRYELLTDNAEYNECVKARMEERDLILKTVVDTDTEEPPQETRRSRRLRQLPPEEEPMAKKQCRM
jgi:hypothetical protein